MERGVVEGEEGNNCFHFCSRQQARGEPWSCRCCCVPLAPPPAALWISLCQFWQGPHLTGLPPNDGTCVWSFPLPRSLCSSSFALRCNCDSSAVSTARSHTPMGILGSQGAKSGSLHAEDDVTVCGEGILPLFAQLCHKRAERGSKPNLLFSNFLTLQLPRRPWALRAEMSGPPATAALPASPH